MSRLALVLLALLVASGCAPSPAAHAGFSGYSIYQGQGGPLAYERELGRWTGELKLYDRGRTSLLLHAVYKSERFRRAWSHEHARRFILPQDDYALLLERELADGSRFHEVLIAAWADDTKRGDFDGDDAPWRLRLVGQSGRTVEPLLVRRIKKPDTEMLVMYPIIDDDDRVYAVKFPVLGPDGLPLLRPDDLALKLQVAGALNRGEVVWPLEPRNLDRKPQPGPR